MVCHAGGTRAAVARGLHVVEKLGTTRHLRSGKSGEFVSTIFLDLKGQVVPTTVLSPDLVLVVLVVLFL